MGNKIKFKDTAKKPNNYKWAITIILWSFIISIVLSYSSSEILSGINLLMAFILLLVLIFIGIVFDIIGIAVATASDVPFHSMAARKIKGSQNAIELIKSSDKVASFCNDVVGDIVGIISGATATVIVARMAQTGAQSTVFSLILTSAVAAFTVGGKALGKGMAMRRADAIVYKVALLLYFKDKLFKRKKK